MTTSAPSIRTHYDSLFIGGRWVPPSTSEVIDVWSPANQRHVGR
ncbi:MAG: Aldehyde dehydrogenase [Mycobacterium sp.]|jgi:hypothetical protein|nr:Aldehyde dehydrogenase [Mycobacterium sp.]